MTSNPEAEQLRAMEVQDFFDDPANKRWLVERVIDEVKRLDLDTIQTDLIGLCRFNIGKGLELEIIYNEMEQAKLRMLASLIEAHRSIEQ